MRINHIYGMKITILCKQDVVICDTTLVFVILHLFV
jgi:hypothetical protein